MIQRMLWVQPMALCLTSVLWAQQLRPRPQQQLRKRKRCPWHPPPHPGGYFGFGEKRKAAPGGRLCGGRRAMPCSVQGLAAGGERGTSTAPRTPRSGPGEQGKRICPT